jgi:5-methylcytosine-specific restriction endonuclease McrA
MVAFTVDGLPGLRFPWYGRIPLPLWLPLKQWVYQRDGGFCAYCGNTTEYTDSHCHHALELSEGGTNHASNLKTLCRDCHKSRHPFMRTARERLHSGASANILKAKVGA